MSPAPHVLAIRCHFCSKQRPWHRLHALQSGQTICDHCIEWHNHAAAFMQGECAPHGCQECGVTWAVLRDSTVGVEVRMYGVPKDGIYQLLCQPCKNLYVAKRADLYRGTQFGDALKL